MELADKFSQVVTSTKVSSNRTKSLATVGLSGAMGHTTLDSGKTTKEMGVGAFTTLVEKCKMACG